MDLSKLRSSRNNDFSKITKEFEKTNTNYVDNRYWKPEKDKAGNATATIRFLPRVEGDDLPWVKIFSHGFKSDATGRWFIEECLTSLMDESGTPKACPMCAYNSTLWNSTTDDASPIRATVRKQKRKLSYVSNIYVVNDPKHPENNGGVFLFKFGKKIYDKIMDKARPTFEDETPVNVFDYWEGANFKLRMKQADGFPNYDASEFESVSAIASTDEAILEIANKQYKLSELLDPSKFKSYSELERKLGTVLAAGAAPVRAESMVTQPTMPPREAKSAPAPTQAGAESDEDMLSYFQQLADDDAPF